MHLMCIKNAWEVNSETRKIDINEVHKIKKKSQQQPPKHYKISPVTSDEPNR